MKDVKNPYFTVWQSDMSLKQQHIMMKKMFDMFIDQYSTTWIKIELTKEHYQRTQTFTTKKCCEKIKEPINQRDSFRMHERNLTGTYAEFAVESYLRELLNMDQFVDTRIGHSKDFDVPDIPTLGLGIKAAEIGKVPAVPITGRNKYPQIICAVDKREDTGLNPLVYICGIADENTLDNFQSEDLILDPNFRARHVKAGFYGYHALKPIDSLLAEPVIKIHPKT